MNAASSNSAVRLSIELLALAAICYALHHRWDRDMSREIHVTNEMVSEIAARSDDLFGRPLTFEERDAAVDDFVDEEILVREAFRRGLHRGDRRVRPMLLDVARKHLLDAAGFEPGTPAEAALRAYYEAHSDRYAVPERVDIDQVVFYSGGEPDAPEAVRAMLRRGVDFRTMGEAGRLNARGRGVSRAQMATAYGLDFTERVFNLPEATWEGPIVSSIGMHFVRVVARAEKAPRPFEDVSDYVREDWIFFEADRVVERQLARIRTRYRVEWLDAE